MQHAESSGTAGAHVQQPTRIVIHIEQQPLRTVVLDRSAFTIGREPGNDILIEHGSVSRRHAQLEQRGNTWYYTDLGSANGSFLNGERISEHLLTDGDEIYLSNPVTGGWVHLTYHTATGVKATPGDYQATILTPQDHSATLFTPSVNTTVLTPMADQEESADTVAGGVMPSPQPAMPPTTPPAAPPAPPPPAYLTIQSTGQPPYDVKLERDSFIIGRGTQSDIVLPQPASRQHGRLERRENTWFYRDLGSTNGTLLNEQRVEETALHDGDILRVGDLQGNWVRLTFHDPAAVAGPTAVARTVGQTIVLGARTTGTADASLFIGRNPESAVPLAAPNVSWQHARLDHTPEGFTLVDLDSTNGTFVNGQRITAPRMLNKDDIIQIGPFRLLFDGTALQQYDQRRGMRIDVRNMTLQVNNGRKILNDVSLTIAPREFVALVGGSGAGKSTLMKAISGFNRATDGNPNPVLVNGDDYYRNFDAYRAVLGYVPQDDILHRLLPVDRALHYSATLRLPTDTGPNEIVERISKSLDVVEMGKHIHTTVDALSGGQRKRVSIACEMLADPSLFFLDEPTSGLDPGLEKKMMYTLRRLADSGRTVLLVTHATDNITQCDHVVFMEMGHMVYFGPPTQALDFFGVTSGSFADIYTHLKADPGDELYTQLTNGVLREEYQAWKKLNPDAPLPPLVDLWKARYHQSEQYRRYVLERQEVQPAMPAVRQAETSDGASARAPRMSVWRQLAVLTRRYIDLTLRDRRNLAILLLQAPLIALLIVLLAAPDALIGSQQPDVVQRISAQSLLFVFVMVGIWFGVINSSSEITKEREVYRRERLSNLSIFAYITSKVTVLTALTVIQNCLLLLIVWMFGFGVDFPTATGVILPAPLELFCSMMLASLAGMSLGLVISAASSNVSQAISMVPLVLIPQILFTGIIFKIEGGLINLFSYLMISRWALDALGTSAGLTNLCQLPNVLEGTVVKTQCAINESLRGKDTSFGSALLRKYIDDPEGFPFPGAFTPQVSHLLTAWGALLAFIVIGLGIVAILLKRQDRRV